MFHADSVDRRGQKRRCQRMAAALEAGAQELDHFIRRVLVQLVDEGVRSLHFYTLNRADLCYAICHLLGLRPPVLGACAVGRTRFSTHRTSRRQSLLCTVKYDL